MRRAIFQSSAEEGRALLARAAVVHLATTGDDGQPILRAVHPVIVRGGGTDILAFHAAPAGEKMEALGRPAVIGAHEVVAEIPSWFLDPERACPATTFYVSVQVDGVLERIDDLATKASALAALMAKYQPEGRHVPIRAEDPLYTKAIAGLLVAGVRLDRVTCKAKLGQNRRLDERRRVVEQLWSRGHPGDAQAVHTLARRFPEIAPPFLRAEGARLSCAIDPEEAGEIADLVEETSASPRPALLAAIRASAAVVTARDESTDELVACGRALSDGCVASIRDVVVREGASADLEARVRAVLLDHPAVRGAVLQDATL